MENVFTYLKILAGLLLITLVALAPGRADSDGIPLDSVHLVKK